MMNKNIFNTEKADYEKTPLFFGDKPGLIDSVNKQYPEIWNLYKKMKSLDWDENEFDYSSCTRDFNTCDKSTYDMMIKTLAWQWEADSVASRCIAPVFAPFITSTELWAAWQRISDNEVIHALTYSEIVRNSFENPSEIVQEILSVGESVDRLVDIEVALANTYTCAHEYALLPEDAVISPDDFNRYYDSVIMGTVALWCLERIKFIASFAVTFGICETGMFMPIGKAVQKIFQDEFEIHCELDRAILNIEFATQRGKDSFNRNKEAIKKILDSVVESERQWIEYLFSDGRELVGIDSNKLFMWVLYNAKELYTYFGIDCVHEFPEKNPIPFLDTWMNISKTQASPQEEKIGAYMIGQIKDTSGSKEFSIDF
jgi:ribonucleoside-diphosphate reductase beta chain